MLKFYLRLLSQTTIATLLALLISSVVHAGSFAAQVEVSGQTLYLNGEGPRKKAFVTVYDTALYLTEKGDDANAIVAADHPMVISLKVKSKLATADRISKALSEGLDRSTDGNTAPIAEQTKSFLGVFQQGVTKGDVFDFNYVPGTGTVIVKNGTRSATIVGLEFKQALFGIWLSDDPIAKKLKKRLLGH